MNHLDITLTSLVASYSVSEAEPKQDFKASKKQNQIVQNQKILDDQKNLPPTVQITLPPKGSLTSKEFLKQLRSSRCLDDRMKAIAGFIGWDGRLTYGEQEFLALSKARKELHPVSAEGLSIADKRQATQSMSGFVAGMPDGMQRAVGNLMAREVQSVEARLEHLKVACHKPNHDSSCCRGHALARVEEERLVFIQSEIKTLVG